MSRAYDLFGAPESFSPLLGSFGDLNGKGYEQVTAGVYYLCTGSSVVRQAQKGGLSHRGPR